MRNFVQQAKRAAKTNPVWKQAILYGSTEADGSAVYSADGQQLFDRIDTTYGFLDYTAEADFTTSITYHGNARLSVISDAAPNGVGLILLEGVFYVVHSVVSSDALLATVKYSCEAVADNGPPIIRNA